MAARLRNGILPVVTYLGPMTANIITGSVVVEQIFGLPGLGAHFVESITNRDYTLIMGITIFYAVILMAARFLTDFVIFLLIRVSKSAEVSLSHECTLKIAPLARTMTKAPFEKLDTKHIEAESYRSRSRSTFARDLGDG